MSFAGAFALGGLRAGLCHAFLVVCLSLSKITHAVLGHFYEIWGMVQEFIESWNITVRVRVRLRVGVSSLCHFQRVVADACLQWRLDLSCCVRCSKYTNVMSFVI